MKLIDKSTLHYFAWLLPVLALAGFIFFYIIQQQIQTSTDESLLKQKNQIIKTFINPSDTNTYFFKYGDGDVVISKSLNATFIKDVFENIELFDSADNETIPYRKLATSFSNHGQNFDLVITRTVIETDELLESIATSLLILFGLLLSGFLIVNRILNRRLWKPFYESLQKLNNFSFTDLKPSFFQQSSIKEFSELNDALNIMTTKMLDDFVSQKQLFENASHELQTPLAVIKSKIDLLIQSPNLKEEDVELLQEMDQSINKLSYLNKSLLLLSKIENRQFEESVSIELSAMIDKVLSDFDDRINLKNIQLEKQFHQKPVLKINAVLAEILFSNLIQNAVRHNIENGSIKIELTTNQFAISNSGESLHGNEEKLFDRFAKFNPSIESHGLGLAIVKQICEYYKFEVSYSYNNNLHTFRINFRIITI